MAGPCSKGVKAAGGRLFTTAPPGLQQGDALRALVRRPGAMSGRARALAPRTHTAVATSDADAPEKKKKVLSPVGLDTEPVHLSVKAPTDGAGEEQSSLLGAAGWYGASASPANLGKGRWRLALNVVRASVGGKGDASEAEAAALGRARDAGLKHTEALKQVLGTPHADARFLLPGVDANEQRTQHGITHWVLEKANPGVPCRGIAACAHGLGTHLKDFDRARPRRAPFLACLARASAATRARADNAIAVPAPG